MLGRRLTTAVTLVALVLILVAMAWFGFSRLTAPFPTSAPTASPTCTKVDSGTRRYLYRKNITVSVYNAGAPQGFAGLTMQRLERLGFNAGTVGNAPGGLTVERAKVFGVSRTDPAARLVARTLGRKVPVVAATETLGPGVSVFVGPRQHLLNRNAPRRVRLPKPESTCVSVQ